MTKHKDDELTTNIKQALGESVDVLDANTLSRVRQIRARAVEKAEARHANGKLKTNIKQALNKSVDTLDANTLSRIRQLRAQAVDRTEARHNNWLGIMSGALATACVMVFAIMILMQSPTTLQSVPIDDLELLSSSEYLELFEDLEFYEWLEEDALPS